MPHLRRHHLERPRQVLLLAVGALTFALGIVVDEFLFNERFAAIVLCALALAIALLCFRQRRIDLAMINARVAVMEPKETNAPLASAQKTSGL